MRRLGRDCSQKMVRSMSTTGCTVEALLVPCAQHRDRQRLVTPCPNQQPLNLQSKQSCTWDWHLQCQ